MFFPGHKKRLALISVHGDPAIEIGKEEAGGQNVYVRQVGEALSRQGWQVDMFTRRSAPDQARIVQHTPDCRTIRLTAGSEKFIPRDELFEHLPKFVEAFQQFQADEGAKYDVIHTNYWLSSWVGMRLKALQGTKHIHTYHSLGAVKYQAISTIPLIAKTRLATEKTCLETAERIIATSPQEQDHMRSLVSTDGNIDIIPCGTDIRRFGCVSRAEARQQLGLAQDAKIVFYVGRFDPRKGIETLVRAVGRLTQRDNLQLIIGGGSRPGQSDGRERDRIEKIVANLGLHTITSFPGRLGLDNLHLYYAAADVCVVPSHYEPFGLVAIEAMASRTPVVASAVGGLQFTVIPEVTGLLAPPKDSAAFSDAIARILANSQWRDQLGDAGRERVEAIFSWDGVAAQLSKLYKRVSKESSQPHVSAQSSSSPVSA
ncbi:glycosyltransferase family 4 protein [Myxacorys almedinensis]|uniref:Glycosyltransferase n=1 Tax=Myxacorys almedinensis A TaxID=2690445 RepID=A0A8J8CJQ7_9CYAN|nr:glycosyltransferase family 1 protein [Myxacorys almedinensis]NDJ19248.1 glycosyltransferase [Myxacorys almedinensis A]